MTTSGSSPPAATCSYDEVPYPSSPYPYTHPDHVGALAWLFGLQPARPERARVLEVGCADGANLIALAVALPCAALLGIDLSGRQIEAGRRVIASLGLGNIELRQGDLCELDAVGPFDYVIAHGVLSWTPRDVQEGLLRLCRRTLALNGVALISYNTLPGWSERHAIHEWLLAAARPEPAAPPDMARARRAMACLRELLGAAGTRHAPYLAELERLAGWNDAYLRHDLLEEHNEPLYFREFVQRLARHGLRFFAEADFAAMAGAGLSSQVIAGVDRIARTLTEREQLLDLCTHRAFRQSLVCHEEVRPATQVRPETVLSLHAASTLRPVETGPGRPARFAGASGFSVEVPEPLADLCLRRLAAVWPAWLPVRGLLADGRRGLSKGGPAAPDGAQWQAQSARLAEILLAGFAERAVELHFGPPPFAAEITGRPEASPLARLQARQGPLVANLRHDLVRLEPLGQSVLPWLDGSRDRAQLLTLLQTASRDGGSAIAAADLALSLDRQLARLARAALLRA